MEIINENTTLIVRLSFKDENSIGVIPSAAQYRIDDVDSGAQILDWTSFTPSADTHDLTITAAQNAIMASDREQEKKRVTVEITYGVTDNKATDEYVYVVKNLTKI